MADIATEINEDTHTNVIDEDPGINSSKKRKTYENRKNSIEPQSTNSDSPKSDTSICSTSSVNMNTSRYGRTRKPKITEDYYNIEDIFGPYERITSSPSRCMKKKSTKLELSPNKNKDCINLNSDMSAVLSINIPEENNIEVTKVLKLVSTTKSPEYSPSSFASKPIKTYANKNKRTSESVVESFGLPDYPVKNFETLNGTQSKKNELQNCNTVDDKSVKHVQKCSENESDFKNLRFFSDESFNSCDSSPEKPLEFPSACRKTRILRHTRKSEVTTHIDIDDKTSNNEANLEKITLKMECKEVDTNSEKFAKVKKNVKIPVVVDNKNKIIQVFDKKHNTGKTRVVLLKKTKSSETVDSKSSKTVKKQVNGFDSTEDNLKQNETDGGMYMPEVGALAWSRVGNYPFWPSLVTNEPGLERHYKFTTMGRKQMKCYHVHFFGDNGRRSWVLATHIFPFQKRSDLEIMARTVSKKSKPKDPKHLSAYIVNSNKLNKWETAVTEAESLTAFPPVQRIEKFFEMVNSKKHEKSDKKRKLSAIKSPKLDMIPKRTKLDHKLLTPKKYRKKLIVKPSKKLSPKTSPTPDTVRIKIEQKSDDEIDELPSNNMEEKTNERKKRAKTIDKFRKSDATTNSDENNSETNRKKTKSVSVVEETKYQQLSTVVSDESFSESETKVPEVEIKCEMRDTPSPVPVLSQAARYKRINLFRGITKDRVCQICGKLNNVIKCKGSCFGLFHIECDNKVRQRVSVKKIALVNVAEDSDSTGDSLDSVMNKNRRSSSSTDAKDLQSSEEKDEEEKKIGKNNDSKPPDKQADKDILKKEEIKIEDNFSDSEEKSNSTVSGLTDKAEHSQNEEQNSEENVSSKVEANQGGAHVVPSIIEEIFDRIFDKTTRESSSQNLSSKSKDCTGTLEDKSSITIEESSALKSLKSSTNEESSALKSLTSSTNEETCALKSLTSSTNEESSASKSLKSSTNDETCALKSLTSSSNEESSASKSLKSSTNEETCASKSPVKKNERTLSLAEKIDLKMQEVMLSLIEQTKYSDSTTDEGSEAEDTSELSYSSLTLESDVKKSEIDSFSEYSHLPMDSIDSTLADSQSTDCSQSQTLSGQEKSQPVSPELESGPRKNSKVVKRIVKHVTADGIFDIIEEEEADTTDYSTFKCTYCSLRVLPPCFICGKDVARLGDSTRHKCMTPQCGKYYHSECLKEWPQAKWLMSTKSNHIDNENLCCPYHNCHTCISDDPRGPNSRHTKEKLAKCIRCPTTYHINSYCIPAGTEILSTYQIMCPKHVLRNELGRKSKAKFMPHVNASWCFICSMGGSLICCETCPSSFHVECLKLSPPEGRYLCEECESGRLPLYDEIVWVKLGAYRWWPAQILFPNEIPENVRNIPHNNGEFVVKFFGSHDHYWVNRGRVFLFQEGDTGHSSSKKSSVDGLFLKAIEEATKAHKKFQDERANRAAEARTGMKPPPYTKIKVNRPVGDVRTADADTSNTTPCDCDPNWEFPCGSDSDCLNRILLTECNPLVCAAGTRCCNQAFEKRQYPPMLPFKTSGRGWGLKSLAPIKKGSFVIEYVGEVINEKEYRRRMKRKHEQKDENYYFLTIDKDRMIDAGPKGNVARFMNHSCAPNCETQKWTVNGDTRVGLFAIMDIPTGAELTFNYNLECIGEEKKECHCKAPNCSGFIGVKAKQDENVKKRKSSLKPKKKKPSIAPEVKPAETVTCFVCSEPDAVQQCDREACNKCYHLNCVELEYPPEGKWLCPWHSCNVCTKRTTRCCYTCINSYCPLHSEGNIRYDRVKGFICTQHDTKESESSASNESTQDTKNQDKLNDTETATDVAGFVKPTKNAIPPRRASKSTKPEIAEPNKTVQDISAEPKDDDPKEPLATLKNKLKKSTVGERRSSRLTLETADKPEEIIKNPSEKTKENARPALKKSSKTTDTEQCKEESLEEVSLEKRIENQPEEEYNEEVPLNERRTEQSKEEENIEVPLNERRMEQSKEENIEELPLNERRTEQSKENHVENMPLSKRREEVKEEILQLVQKVVHSNSVNNLQKEEDDEDAVSLDKRKETINEKISSQSAKEVSKKTRTLNKLNTEKKNEDSSAASNKEAFKNDALDEDITLAKEVPKKVRKNDALDEDIPLAKEVPKKARTLRSKSEVELKNHEASSLKKDQTIKSDASDEEISLAQLKDAGNLFLKELTTKKRTVSQRSSNTAENLSESSEEFKKDNSSHKESVEKRSIKEEQSDKDEHDDCTKAINISSHKQIKEEKVNNNRSLLDSTQSDSESDFKSTVHSGKKRKLRLSLRKSSENAAELKLRSSKDRRSLSEDEDDKPLVSFKKIKLEINNFLNKIKDSVNMKRSEEDAKKKDREEKKSTSEENDSKMRRSTRHSTPHVDFNSIKESLNLQLVESNLKKRTLSATELTSSDEATNASSESDFEDKIELFSIRNTNVKKLNSSRLVESSSSKEDKRKKELRSNKKRDVWRNKEKMKKTKQLNSSANEETQALDKDTGRIESKSKKQKLNYSKSEQSEDTKGTRKETTHKIEDKSKKSKLNASKSEESKIEIRNAKREDRLSSSGDAKKEDNKVMKDKKTMKKSRENKINLKSPIGIRNSLRSHHIIEFSDSKSSNSEANKTTKIPLFSDDETVESLKNHSTDSEETCDSQDELNNTSASSKLIKTTVKKKFNLSLRKSDPKTPPKSDLKSPQNELTSPMEKTGTPKKLKVPKKIGSRKSLRNTKSDGAHLSSEETHDVDLEHPMHNSTLNEDSIEDVLHSSVESLTDNEMKPAKKPKSSVGESSEKEPPKISSSKMKKFRSGSRKSLRSHRTGDNHELSESIGEHTDQNSVDHLLSPNSSQSEDHLDSSVEDDDHTDSDDETQMDKNNSTEHAETEQVKRKRGRPRKYPKDFVKYEGPKRPRGRPRKQLISIEEPPAKQNVETVTELYKMKLNTDTLPKNPYENHVNEVKLTSNVPARHLRVVLRKHSEIDSKIDSKFLKMQNDIERDLPIRKRSKLRYEAQL